MNITKQWSAVIITCLLAGICAVVTMHFTAPVFNPGRLARIFDKPGYKLLSPVNETWKKALQPAPAHLVFVVDPTCEYCEEELAGVSRSLEHFPPANIYVFSTAEPDSLQPFFKKFDLGRDGRRVFLVQDKAMQFMREHQLLSIPSVAIFDQDGKFKKKLEGPVKTDYLIKQLQ